MSRPRPAVLRQCTFGEARWATAPVRTFWRLGNYLLPGIEPRIAYVRIVRYPPPGVLKVTRINSGNVSLPNPVKDWDQSIVNWSSSRECAMTVCTEYVNSYSRRCTYNEHNLDMNWFAPFSA